MDIRKLQRTIVAGLENVKAHDIAVFNTEHLSALFERVIIASGTSNRQTKALAAGVRDAVRAKGFAVLRTEGEDNGEWIIVDCGAAVVHVMQPSIREYYHLEEIWGGKPVRIKLDNAPRQLVKAQEPQAAGMPKPLGTAAKTALKRAAPARSASERAPSAAKKTAAAASGKSSRKTAAAPARKLAARPAATRSVGVRRSRPAGEGATEPSSPQPVRRSAGKTVVEVPVRKSAARKSAAGKATRKSPAAKAGRGG